MIEFEVFEKSGSMGSFRDAALGGGTDYSAAYLKAVDYINKYKPKYDHTVLIVVMDDWHPSDSGC